MAKSNRTRGTHTPDDGHLMALLDGQSDDRTAPAQGADAERLASMQAEREEVSKVLSTLAPNPLEGPNRRRAYARFQQSIDEDRRTHLMIKKLQTSKRAQRIAAAVAAVVVLAGLLALAPVRAFASNMLSVFRVEGFAVVDIEPERIEEIANAIDENMYWGEADFVSGGGEPTEVASMEEAAELVGFTPAAPADAGEPAFVGTNPAAVMEFTPELETLRAVFEALGLDTSLLPDELDDEPFVISVEAGVAALYGTEEDGVVVTQIPAPQVDVPEGVDMQELGVAMLQLLGMDADEAARLSEEIDFTSTLVLPIPTTDLGSVVEVDVNGATGLVFDGEGYWDEETDTFIPGGAGVMWQADGFIYLVASQNADTFEVVSLARGLE